MTREQEFKVNEFLTVKLEEPFDPRATRYTTVIYVGGRYFRQCKFLLLNIPIENVSSFDEIDSIDEAAEKLDKSQEPVEGYEPIIPPEVEFWGHCSNLQVWYENDYDTRLLHSNLAFSLLKRLTEEGDPLAKRMFKEEIAKRLARGYMPVIEYLQQEEYIAYLTHEEMLSALLKPEELNAILELESYENRKFKISLDEQHYSIGEDDLLIINNVVKGITIRIKDNTIPKIIIKLRNLKILYLILNYSKKFPSFIFEFNNLNELFLIGLEIEKLPEKICLMQNLETLDFDETIIKELPLCLVQMKSLKYFGMPYFEPLSQHNKEVIEKMKKKGIKVNLSKYTG